ncbi:hypothetical protein [Raineyella fluvialis]|uniref:Uncharacterized protein n=1 Tax=Raineyella fluvialis TaxID=2662261 RepID=A0A5Q2F9T9_9ACTN|nr:hypothetical protein [Raineyella fluvialis]QGF23662.1 hypothetical protein Rai3103_08245 [Raineyella fluvialis]
MSVSSFDEAERRRLARLARHEASMRYRRRTRILRLAGLAVAVLVLVLVVVR